MTALELDYRVSHRLVRGLDYYARTTFEVLGSALGAQNALLGGGRYDGLVKQLGGPDRAGIGFAAGMERLVLAMPEGPWAAAPDAFVVALGEAARPAAHVLARDLRHAGVATLVDYDARSLRAQNETGGPVRRAPGAHPRRRRDRPRRGHREDMQSGEQAAVARAEVVRRMSERYSAGAGRGIRR